MGANNTEPTGKEKRFCEEYVIDYNGKRAAIRAGYAEPSAAKTACRLLKRKEILDYVSQLQKEQKKRLCLSSDRVVAELLEILERCKQPEPVMVWDSKNHAYVESGEYGFDSKGAVKAMELLMRHMGMLDGKKADTQDAPVWLMDDLDAEPGREDSGGKTGLDGKDGQP